METICQGKRVTLPVGPTLASVHMRKKVDPLCPSQRRSRMLWLSRLDRVDPAERVKVFTAISRKVVGKSARDNPERYSGWFWVQCSSKKFEKMAQEAMDVCWRVLRNATKVGSTATVSGTVYRSYPILPFGSVACSFSDNLSRNCCI